MGGYSYRGFDPQPYDMGKKRRAFFAGEADALGSGGDAAEAA